MKKELITLTIVLSALSLQSCQNSLDIPTPASRNYRQDVEILNKFMDINRTVHGYYINPNKRSSVLSYITNADTEELNAVNPLNLNSFEQSIDRISNLSGEFAASRSADYIVMMTMNEIYTSTVNPSSPVVLKDSPESFNGSPVVASLKIADRKEEYFTGGTRFGMAVNLKPDAYKNAGWAFLLTCKPGRDKEDVKILFCGVGFNIRPYFELAAVQGAYTDWKFEVTNLNDNVYVADLKILRL